MWKMLACWRALVFVLSAQAVSGKTKSDRRPVERWPRCSDGSTPSVSFSFVQACCAAVTSKAASVKFATLRMEASA